MELKNLEGKIIGVIADIMEDDINPNTLVNTLIPKKIDEALKMVDLDNDIKNKLVADLSSRERNKVILASKLQDDVIILYDFTKGLTKKDLDYFKKLFKKIVLYNKKIILVTKDSEMFLNCVDKIYLINNDSIIVETTDIFEPTLYMDINPPAIVNFIYKCQEAGVSLDEYTDLNELIKSIFRIKS